MIISYFFVFINRIIGVPMIEKVNTVNKKYDKDPPCNMKLKTPHKKAPSRWILRKQNLLALNSIVLLFIVQIMTIDFHILNFTALSVVGVLQYSLLPLAL